MTGICAICHPTYKQRTRSAKLTRARSRSERASERFHFVDMNIEVLWSAIRNVIKINSPRLFYMKQNRNQFYRDQRQPPLRERGPRFSSLRRVRQKSSSYFVRISSLSWRKGQRNSPPFPDIVAIPSSRRRIRNIDVEWKSQLAHSERSSCSYIENYSDMRNLLR